MASSPRCQLFHVRHSPLHNWANSVWAGSKRRGPTPGGNPRRDRSPKALLWFSAADHSGIPHTRRRHTGSGQIDTLAPWPPSRTASQGCPALSTCPATGGITRGAAPHRRGQQSASSGAATPRRRAAPHVPSAPTPPTHCPTHCPQRRAGQPRHLGGRPPGLHLCLPLHRSPHEQEQVSEGHAGRAAGLGCVGPGWAVGLCVEGGLAWAGQTPHSSTHPLSSR